MHSATAAPELSMTLSMVYFVHRGQSCARDIVLDRLLVSFHSLHTFSCIILHDDGPSGPQPDHCTRSPRISQAGELLMLETSSLDRMPRDAGSAIPSRGRNAASPNQRESPATAIEGFEDEASPRSTTCTRQYRSPTPLAHHGRRLTPSSLTLILRFAAFFAPSGAKDIAKSKPAAHWNGAVNGLCSPALFWLLVPRPSCSHDLSRNISPATYRCSPWPGAQCLAKRPIWRRR